jgi:N-dimethylarginine dimethylaminohydrolase
MHDNLGSLVPPTPLGASSDWATLRTVAIVAPTYYRRLEGASETEKSYWTDASPPSAEAVSVEHSELRKRLEEHGAWVIDIPPRPDLPLQFNVRDAAFIIDDKLILSRIQREARKAEPAAVADRLAVGFGSATTLALGRIEGGDVLLTPRHVLVGVSRRSDIDGAEELRHILNRRRSVATVPVHPRARHLDMALTVLGKDVLVAHADSLPDGLPRPLSHLRPIFVSDTEFQIAGANILALSPHSVILDQRSDRLASKLESAGLHCIPLHVDQMTKAGGGIRCATLPLYRQ